MISFYLTTRSLQMITSGHIKQRERLESPNGPDTLSVCVIIALACVGVSELSRCTYTPPTFS
jgi:hypothetical protein